MRVSALFVYPVKSLRGIAVGAAEVERRGFAGDRRWMVVDDDGVFVTQRELPRMARLGVALAPDAVTLSAADAGELALPRSLARGVRKRVRVWQSELDATVFAPARPWLRRALGVEADLVYLPDDVERSVDPERAGAGYVTSFADAYPFLVISEASVEDLERRADTSLGARRFRPNVVVRGAPAYDEDEWVRVRIGDIDFRGVKRCSRCTITTVDPDSGERGPEPLRTLADFRRKDDQVWFGMNLVHDGQGRLELGAAVQVVERHAPDP